MPLALWTLLWLNFRAFARRMGRQLRSPRGIIFFLIGVGMIGFWLVPTIFMNRHLPQRDPRATLALAPVAILLVCLMNLFTSAGDRAFSFTPAEVDFLFPGPFSRRSLLIYKLIKTGTGTLFSALIFSVILSRYGGVFVYRFAGIWLLFQFMQLLAMTVALVQAIVGERLITAGRWGIVVVLALAAAIGFAEVFNNHHALNISELTEMRDTVAGRVVLAPFTVFAHMLVARDFIPGFMGWAAMAAGIDLTMASVIIGLDANYLETAATISARRYDRMSRFRRSGLSGLAKPGTARRKIPMLPWAAGTGPIAWRQLTTALRTARTMLIFLGTTAVAIGIGLSRATDQRSSIGFLVGVMLYLNVFLSQMLKFDFRGDLDYLDVLRALPLRPSAVAAAQLLTPSLLLSIVEMILLVTLSVVGHLPTSYLIAAAVFVVPVNLLTIAADNLMFLLFPFRPATAVAGDMGLIGRQTIVFACRSFVLILCAGISFGIGTLVWFITNRSWTIAAIAAWIPLIAAIVLMTWFIAMAFKRFDPSVSTPA